MNDIVGKNLILAPLAGISGSSFRFLCHEEGAALSYTEMVSAKGMYYKSPGSFELLHIEENEGPVAVQLFGSDPKIMAWAVKEITEKNLCGTPPCEININMGCPVPKVYNNGEGSALLKDEALAFEIVNAMAEASDISSIPISVKMRLCSKDGDLGRKDLRFDSFRYELDEREEILPYDMERTISFAKAMEIAGAKKIIVHGRTREQYYSGRADWNAIKKIKENLSVEVIGNGDVRSFKEAEERMAFSSCDGIMIGRGSMGNPWVFSGKTPGIEDRKMMIRKHLMLLEKEKITVRAILEMRKHFAWYTKGLPGASALREKINKCETEKEILDLIDMLN